jgi:hypothetical protein
MVAGCSAAGPVARRGPGGVAAGRTRGGSDRGSASRAGIGPVRASTAGPVAAGCPASRRSVAGGLSGEMAGRELAVVTSPVPGSGTCRAMATWRSVGTSAARGSTRGGLGTGRSRAARGGGPAGGSEAGRRIGGSSAGLSTRAAGVGASTGSGRGTGGSSSASSSHTARAGAVAGSGPSTGPASSRRGGAGGCSPVSPAWGGGVPSPRGRSAIRASTSGAIGKPGSASAPAVAKISAVTSAVAGSRPAGALPAGPGGAMARRPVGRSGAKLGWKGGRALAPVASPAARSTRFCTKFLTGVLPRPVLLPTGRDSAAV